MSTGILYTIICGVPIVLLVLGAIYFIHALATAPNGCEIPYVGFIEE